MWDPPGSGIKLVSPALTGGFFTTEPPRKPCCVVFNLHFLEYNIIHSTTPEKNKAEWVQWLRSRDSLLKYLQGFFSAYRKWLQNSNNIEMCITGDITCMNKSVSILKKFFSMLILTHSLYMYIYYICVYVYTLYVYRDEIILHILLFRLLSLLSILRVFSMHMHIVESVMLKENSSVELLHNFSPNPTLISSWSIYNIFP